MADGSAPVEGQTLAQIAYAEGQRIARDNPGLTQEAIQAKARANYSQAEVVEGIAAGADSVQAQAEQKE